MTDDTMTDAELDAVLDELEAADLVEQYVTEDGKPATRLTEQGVRARTERRPAARRSG